MSRNANPSLPAVLLLLQCFVTALSSAQTNGSFVQADVYDALYDSNVRCDDKFDQPRSEFITKEIERNGGNRLSKEMLAKLLAFNVETARRVIVDKTKERERYLSEMLRAPKVSSEESVEEREASRKRHEELRQIDDLLSKQRRYVEVYECIVLELQRK